MSMVQESTGTTVSYAEAIAYCQQCLAQGQAEALLQLASQLTERFPRKLEPLNFLYHGNMYLSRIEESRVTAKKMHTLEPENPDAMGMLAFAMYLQGEHDEALALMRTAISIQPKNAENWHKIGVMHKGKGDKKDAKDAFSKAFKIDQRMLMSLYEKSFLTGAKDARKEIAKMQILLRKGSWSEEEQGIINFAMARNYGYLNEIDKEFECLRYSNGVISKNISYQHQQTMNYSRSLLQDVDEGWVKNCAAGPAAPLTPIVIVSMPRAGSSLLESILGAHSKIYNCGESGAMNQAVAAVSQRIQSNEKYWCWNDGQDFAQYFQEIDKKFMSLIDTDKDGRTHFTEKSINNFLYVPIYLLRYPNARVIHCRRHPLDVCLSNYQIRFASGQASSYDLKHTAELYGRHIDLMDLWSSLFPERIMTLEYEQLVADQEVITRKIVDFAGLEWEESCLNFQDSMGTVNTASAHQVREGLNNNSVHRWKRYAAHLKPAADVLNLQLD
jgi:tetratricopeptide (TPR) repeat protein